MSSPAVSDEGRSGAFAAALVETASYAALIAVPVFFNVYSERTFEEDKILLLRSLAAVVLAGLTVRVVAGAERSTLRSIWRAPLVVPVLVLTAAYLLSTVLGIAPARSFWGGYDRAQGTYTWLACVAFFFASLLVARDRGAERLVTAMLLASLPAALYGVVQSLDWDPIAWGAAGRVPRVHGTAGNPIFLSAFLIMVFPLGLARAARSLERLSATRRAGEAGRLGAGIESAAYLVLLLLQALAILYSQSRGPAIGLVAGLAFFFLLLWVLRQSRRLLLAAGATLLIAAVVLALSVLPGTAVEPRRADDTGETQSVRALIWKGAAELLSSDPARLLVGYGPESLFLAYNRFYPPEVAHYEQRDVSPDRAHNETFDTMVSIGLFGLLAELAVYLAFFSCVLARLGVLATTAQRRTFLLFAIGGAIAGTVLAWTTDVRFCGIGLPIGFAAGMAAYLGARALARPRALDADPGILLLAALFAAVLGHFAEIQVGIATSATRLYFLVFAGIAAGLTWRGEPVVTEAPQPRPYLVGALAGLALILLTFDLWLPTTDVRRYAATFALLFSATWVFGAVLALEGSAFAAGKGIRGRAAALLGRYALASLGLWGTFAAVYLPWVGSAPGGESVATVRAIGVHLAACVSIIYAAVLLLIALVAAGAAWDAARGRTSPPHWRATACALLLLPIVCVLIADNLLAARADAFSKLGGIYERGGHRSAAVFAHVESLRLEPAQDRYAATAARALMERARRVGGPDSIQRDNDLQLAARVLRRAEKAHPLDPDHPSNLARLYHLWGHAGEDARRDDRFDTAERAYGRALELKPNNADLWNELATLYAERGRPLQALPVFERSLKLDDRYAQTYWLRGETYFALGRFAEALQDYDRSLTLDPQSVAAWSSKALALARLGRNAEAIEANQRVVARVPEDFVSHRNLAVLYQRLGNLPRALAEARAALRFAKPSQRPPLQEFIDAVESQPASAATSD